MEDKKQAWRMLAYPDSALDDWESELNQRGLCWVRSPLHDKDTKKDGNLVKPHYHLIVIWPNRTTFKNACSLAESLRFKVPVKPCDYPLEAYKYFSHDENSEKEKYNLSDCTHSESFSLKVLVELKQEEEDEIISLIKRIIVERRPLNYYQLDNYLEAMQKDDVRLWRYERAHTMYFKEIMRGYREQFDADDKRKSLDKLASDIKKQLSDNMQKMTKGED